MKFYNQETCLKFTNAKSQFSQNFQNLQNQDFLDSLYLMRFHFFLMFFIQTLNKSFQAAA